MRPRPLLRWLAAAVPTVVTAAAPSQSLPGAAEQVLAELPAAFVPNAGQAEHGLFLAQIGGIATVVEQGGLLLGLAGEPHADRVDGATVRLRFVDAADCEVVAEQQMAGRVSYFLGNDASRWRSGLGRFARVRWQEPWRGVDLTCYGTAGHLEYDVELQPGADLAAVEFAVEGCQALRVDEDGSLVIHTAAGPLRQTAPDSWIVETDGTRRSVAVRYELHGAARFGLVAPQWTGDSRLVVDPGLLWSTYIGQANHPRNVSVDAAGVITVGGFIQSANNPTTPGSWSQAFAGVFDTLVVKLDPSQPPANQLIAATFIGGPSLNGILGMHVDPSGAVTAVGFCDGPGFPTVNPYQPMHAGPIGVNETVVFRLDPTLSLLLYATYLGGSGADRCGDVCYDPATGRITVLGYTASTDYPTTPGAFQTSYGGGAADAVVVQLDPSVAPASQLVYATYLGGSGEDRPDVNTGSHALAVAANGQITICGRTDSSNFPVTANAYDFTANGGMDGFITRIDPTQTPLVYSTYLGGYGTDVLKAIHVDGSGVVTAAGSGGGGFPVAGTPYQSSISGTSCCSVGILTRLDPSLPPNSQLLYSTFFGGPGPAGREVLIYDLSVDASGIIAFAAGAYNVTLPTTPGAWDRTANGDWDVYLGRLDPNQLAAEQLLYGTYLGGPNYDVPTALSMAGTIATVAGVCAVGFPVTANAFQPTFAGSPGFVCQLDMQPLGPPVLTAISPNPVVNNMTGAMTLTGTDLQNTQSVSVNGQPATNVNATATQITFALPTTFVLGTGQPVTVTDDLGRTSNTLPLDVVGANPPVLDVLPVGVQGTPLSYRMFADANDLSILLVSPYLGLTLVPGVVTLQIGNGSLADVYNAGLFLHGPNGIAQTFITYPTLLTMGFMVHAQAITFDFLNLTFPLQTTNAKTTTLF